MIEPPPYPDEDKRLEALKSTQLLDMPIEERFERITRMVCKLLDVPIAIFNLIDKDRQHYKSVQGLNSTDATLDGAYCTHALHEKDMMLVTDASKDERFHDNPFVTGKFLNIGFYAGVPLRTGDGMPVGTLCAIDLKPRKLSAEELAMLRDLTAMAENELKVSNISIAQNHLTNELGHDGATALVDPLTRLWSRQGMAKILQQDWHLSAKDGTPLTIILVAINDFDQLKKLHSAQMMEGLLRIVAKKLLQPFRIEDAAGRFDDDQFIVVVRDEKSTRQTLQNIISQVQDLVQADSFVMGLAKRYPVNLSFGIATAGSGDKSAEDLLKKAEKALKEAKSGAGVRIKFAA